MFMHYSYEQTSLRTPSAMPRSLLSSRYKFGCLKAKNRMSSSVSFAKASKCTRIWDPLKREINTRSMLKNSKDFKSRLQSHQRALLQSKDWLTSDLVPFTIRYELEKRHNIELMAHYGDDDGTSNTEDSMTSDEDSNDENVYFDPKPRRINFDDLECENCVASETDTKAEIVPKRKRNKLLGDEAIKKFTCDICQKFFEKRWALNSHMLLHSGDKPFRCTYKTCTKQYADRSNLRAHQRSKIHHSWKIFCKQCTKPFSEQRYLNLHSLSACRKYLAGVSKKTIP